MKENKNKLSLNDILTNIVLVVCVAFFLFAGWNFLNSSESGDKPTVFGYRPVYVLTGSMEPTMKTNSIMITKEVESIDELSVGDIITYHVKTDKDKTLRITHRIQMINEDGTIITKGDNNPREDATPLTMDNVEAKVVLIMNWVASLIDLWATTSGKIMIICFTSGIIIVGIAMKLFFAKDDLEEAK